MTDAPAANAILPGDELAGYRSKAGQPMVTPATGRDRGVGPFKRLVLRGATVIDGTGAPPIGPTDIVIENNRITLMKKATGNLSTAANRVAEGDKEIDCRGKWLHRRPRPCRRRLSLGQRLGAAGRCEHRPPPVLLAQQATTNVRFFTWLLPAFYARPRRGDRFLWLSSSGKGA